MKTHKFDLLSFLSGSVMAAFGLLFLLPAVWTDIFDVFDTVQGWFWPLVFLLGGVGVIVSTVTTERGKQDKTDAADHVD